MQNMFHIEYQNQSMEQVNLKLKQIKKCLILKIDAKDISIQLGNLTERLDKFKIKK